MGLSDAIRPVMDLSSAIRLAMGLGGSEVGLPLLFLSPFLFSVCKILFEDNLNV